MVYRIYVEKKPGFAQEAESLRRELTGFLGISGLERLRLLNRYDAEFISKEQFEAAVPTVFSEPQVDTALETPELAGADAVFAVEYLPGQFDQRADSAAQCVQLMFRSERPLIRSARVYALYGRLSSEELAQIKKYVINPVEAREASLELPATLKTEYEIPTGVKSLEGFRELNEKGLAAMIREYGLAMDEADIAFCQAWFKGERRDPTITELRMIDTYWSDHCRHTTFHTVIDRAGFADPELQRTWEDYLALRRELGRTKPVCLMDLATIAVRDLKRRGKLDKLDESEEINACTVKITVEVDGKAEPWLLLFKNETHNHPTEIEPFGGAATCIGGAIRDPLSGRAYVYGAMRVTGAADPTAPVSETIPGKLPQRKLVTTAAAGYASYGNQIGLATGLVEELYHPGYAAKRMEIGAVIAAAPQANVRRERPLPGDLVILLGGSTGRDGIGGATGSSKSHDSHSLATMASEVQKGNAPEERKLQRLFRRGDVTRRIKRCNDFGAGGVSVAVGELAAGLDIDLDAVRKKYDGLDGTELAISESQERMAVVVAPEDEAAMIAAAAEENLEAYRVAVVTESPRMVMRWRGQVIADLSRAFLDTNGAAKHARVRVAAPKAESDKNYVNLNDMAGSLRCASRRGLIERFDSTIGAGTLLAPFGGETRRSPAQAMAALLPVLPGQHTDSGSVMAQAMDPEAMCASPYAGAYGAVYSSVAKLVAAGADYEKAYLTLQEFFEKLRDEPERWGKPFAALLGALDAQMELGAAAIGGKDSMSGSFLDLDVPPTLISFAIAPIQAQALLTPEFQAAGHPVYLFVPDHSGATAPTAAWETFQDCRRRGLVLSARAVEHGAAEALMQMGFGNRVGFRAAAGTDAWMYALNLQGCIVAELAEEVELAGVVRLGETIAEPVLELEHERETLDALLERNEAVLEDVYPTYTVEPAAAPTCTWTGTAPVAAPALKSARPRALIPVFPGTNCEYDTARALLEAGAEPEILVIRNLSAQAVAESAERFARALESANLVVIPGGFSGGDEPEGSAKLITAFFRSPAVREQTTALLERRDGLMLGICNGFQALVKLGLVPFGKILDPEESSPTLSFNRIGRHQSQLVRTRVCSTRSPWLAGTQVGQVYTVPISHGEGRFLASEELLRTLAENGQIATQYVNAAGEASMDTAFNPNGSLWAVEGITSPDGRVLGKMGHSERVGSLLYRNVPGRYDMKLFESAVRYFK